MKKRDESLEEIWEIRRQISRRFGGDPHKAAAYYLQKQKKSGAKLYKREERLTLGN
jgi:hypothetical protein